MRDYRPNQRLEVDAVNLLKSPSLCPLIALMAGLAITLEPSPANAADRGAGMQKGTLAKTTANPKKRGFFSLLFGGRADDRRKSALTESARARNTAARAFLQPSRVVHVPTEVTLAALDTRTPAEGRIASRPYPEAPMLVIRSHDNQPVLVQPLLAAIAGPDHGSSQPESPTTDVTAALDLAVPSSPKNPAPAEPQTPEEPVARAAVPLFASPVPGRPGLVYPPGLERIPENIVDVTGLTPGSKARDPLTKVIFLVP
jgi:hypothetical protein